MHPQSQKLRDLAEKWADVPAGEFANAQMYLGELATALGVEPPQPKGSGYEYEFYVLSTDRKSGKESKQRIDLYKKDHFILEAKHVDGTRSAESVLRAAYAQAKGYASDVPHAPPPYLMVVDVGRTLMVWDRWSGTYGGFNLARRIDLRTLADRPEEIDFLRAVWENPASLDPRGRAAAVTRGVAERLAVLSASLEGRGHDAERVARFLIRCVFTMFAEDVGLLAGKPFQTAIEDYQADPDEFAGAMESLWAAMDKGSRFGIKKLLRFNGHFFKDAEALPLTRADMAVLLDAAKADWTTVEPTIFGTLLTRALDPRERHRLGAEYTPREYVERVVRQTVEVPIRERWSPVQTEVFQLRESGTKKKLATALGHLRDFHAWMRGLRFLDPACGSGNFLYVTLHTVKRIELEVLREIEKITGNPELGIEEVGPGQFHGIEVKPWAREIAELTLWIGFHQFWLEHHKGVNPPEPVLKDTGTLEQRDAVLAWDEIAEIPEKSRPDPTPRIPHPVTGKLVPDPNARLPYYEYREARQAEWPHADFIVGNPPYMGGTRMREAFGDGYVDALRSVYREVPEGADYVMYWWIRAAEAITSCQAVRAGLITTNSITQTRNRGIVENAALSGASVVWAIADHPWVDEQGGAAVRVAMTVLAHQPQSATLVQVDENAQVILEATAKRLNADLSISADVAGAVTSPLRANIGISFLGFLVNGPGFILECQEALNLLKADPRNAEIVKPYLNGKDLADRPRDVYVIDFGSREVEEARSYPVLYNLVVDRVRADPGWI